jgi:hypothetical protein
MKRGSRSILTTVTLLFIVLFLIQCGSSRESNWNERLMPNTRNPYDLSLMEKLMEKTYSKMGEFNTIEVSDNLQEEIERATYFHNNSGLNSTGTYIYVGDKLNIKLEEYQSLLEFVQAGNSVFISANDILMYDFTELISAEEEDAYYYEEEEHDYEEEVYTDSFIYNLNFEPNVFSIEDTAIFQVKNKGTYKFSRYLPKQYGENQVWNDISYDHDISNTHLTDYKEVGTVNDKVGSMKFKYGDGTIIIHSNPVVFTNYFLKEDQGYKYMKDVFSYLPSSNVVYWDNQSRFTKYRNMNRDKSVYPLSIVMENNSLKALIYLIVVLTLLFVIFNSKRKQRIIPLLPDNRNTSIAFSETIGSLYFQAGNNKKLCEKMMKMFRFQIRKKWGIATANLDKEIIRDIARRSGMTEAFIYDIFNQWKRLEQFDNVSSEELISLHQNIELFYTNMNKEYGK